MEEKKIINLESCPICKKPAVMEYRPFCSKGCYSVDLNRWLSESYRIPVEDMDVSSTPNIMPAPSDTKKFIKDE